MKNRRKFEEGEEIKLSSSPVMRGFLIVLGILFILLGIVGLFLPIVPTTPFLLVATACFARSSPRFYFWLLNNRYFGAYIKAWRHEHRIPLKAKILAVTTIVLTIGYSVVWLVPLIAIKVLLALTGITVIAYICHFPN